MLKIKAKLNHACVFYGAFGEKNDICIDPRFLANEWVWTSSPPTGGSGNRRVWLQNRDFEIKLFSVVYQEYILNDLIIRL